DSEPSDSESDSSDEDNQMSKLKAREPDTFTGEGKDRSTEAVRKFKQSVFDYLELKGVAQTDPKGLIFAGSYLEGAAKAWYEAQRKEAPEDDPFTLTNLLDGLRRLYIPSTDKSAEFGKWMDCKQIKNGKIRP